MKVAVIGASGIIGQHLHISIPEGVEPVFTRRTPHPLYSTLDLSYPSEIVAGPVHQWLIDVNPDTIILLAGQNDPDKFESPGGNTYDPSPIINWCKGHDTHLIYVSTQAVFGGLAPRYRVEDPPDRPVNAYGFNKCMWEKSVMATARHWTIVRPTFVLGIRPFPAIGRINPAERMLSGQETYSVDNRWFSISFAWDVANFLWSTCRAQELVHGKVLHFGNPERLSRYDVARALGATVEPVTHEHLMQVHDLVDRPRDTTYADGIFYTPFSEGIERLKSQYRDPEQGSFVRELSVFLKQSIHSTYERFNKGFSYHHSAVSDSFRTASPTTDDQLLGWYRTTDSYLWELSSYHTDPGFNYSGMCQGIIDRLRAQAGPCVLILGDGIGTLTIKLKQAGFSPIYHDLDGSLTSKFAECRWSMRFPDPFPARLSSSWNFPLYNTYHAVIALDFLEHAPNVEHWVTEIHRTLNPGGIFIAQNAFNIGSGSSGSMPMHLSINDHWEQDWDPFLFSLGFKQLSSNWYQKQ